MPSRTGKYRGYTLVELIVVVVVIAVLAAIALPPLRSNIERSRATEAFNFFGSFVATQQCYQAVHGTYVDDLTQLSIDVPDCKYFAIGTPAPGRTGSLTDSWTLTLTRQGFASGYGAYTVVFTDEGYDRTNSTIPPQIDPTGG